MTDREDTPVMINNLAQFTEDLITLFDQELDGETPDQETLVRVQQAKLDESDWWAVFTEHWPCNTILDLSAALEWIQDSPLWQPPDAPATATKRRNRARATASNRGVPHDGPR